MNVAIIGSREFNNFDYALEKVIEFIETDNNQISKIVSGGAAGADTIAEQIAMYMGIPTKIFLPNWDKHGKSAGFVRNTQIVENSDIIIAFWDGLSKGTLDSINKAKSLGKRVIVHNYKGGLNV